MLNPELEIRIWADSPHVAKSLGLSKKQLEEILAQHDRDANGKPKDPKTVMEAALRKANLRRSSAIYANLAASVSFKNCRDQSFSDFKSALVGWFGPLPNRMEQPE